MNDIRPNDVIRQKVICITHNRDLDGHTSGAVVSHKYPEAIIIGFDYSEKLNLEKYKLEEYDVIMCDVSIPPQQMEELASKCKSFTWIDHHHSANSDFYKYFEKREIPKNLIYVYKLGMAACEITWHYLFPYTFIPIAVQMLADYDVWRNENRTVWEKTTLPFQMGMRLICSSPKTFPKHFLNNSWTEAQLNKIFDQGEAIVQYEKSKNSTLCAHYAFEQEIDGYRAICLNTTGNSAAFDSVYNPEIHDLMLRFTMREGEYNFSAYTTKENVDCSAIAKKRGGGGHKKAAGFQVKNIKDIFPKMS